MISIFQLLKRLIYNFKLRCIKIKKLKREKLLNNNV